MNKLKPSRLGKNMKRIYAYILIIHSLTLHACQPQSEFEAKRAHASDKEVAQLLSCDTQKLRELFRKKLVSQELCNVSLLEAAKQGKQAKTVRILLEERANPGYMEEGMHPLLAAAQSGSLEITKVLLETLDIDPALVVQAVELLLDDENQQKHTQDPQILNELQKYPGKQTVLFHERAVKALAMNSPSADYTRFKMLVASQPLLLVKRYLPTFENDTRAPTDERHKPNFITMHNMLHNVYTRMLTNTREVLLDELQQEALEQESEQAGE